MLTPEARAAAGSRLLSWLPLRWRQRSRALRCGVWGLEAGAVGTTARPACTAAVRCRSLGYSFSSASAPLLPPLPLCSSELTSIITGDGRGSGSAHGGGALARKLAAEEGALLAPHGYKPA